MTDPRYPIGRFVRPETLDAPARQAALETIAATPDRFRAAVAGLDDTRLDTPYREGGWTVRQLAHHLPDSHMNAYIRIKLGLTAETPRVMAYDEARWAELPDSAGPIAGSLILLEALHERWVRMMRTMTQEDWARTIDHPENGPMRLDQVLALYAWHGPHHTAHVTSLRARMGW